jgi:hypothetical protein
MTDVDTAGAEVRHRWVISRQPPWWVVTFYAPGLPAEGVRHRCRTHAAACEAWYHLYPEVYRGMGVVPEYDLGDDTKAKDAAYCHAYLAKVAADDTYRMAGAAITSALARDHQASLRDIASILHQSYWRVSRIQAYRLRYGPQWLARSVHWVRPYRLQRLAGRSLRQATILGRQARIIAADTIRETRRAAESRMGQ